MDSMSIASILSGGLGTRIPEEYLGLPARSARYDRSYSMDAIRPLGARSARSVQESTPDRSVAGVSVPQTTREEALTVDGKTFAELLSDVLSAQNTVSSASPELTDALSLFQSRALGSLTGSLTAANLATFGTSGLTTLGLGTL